MDRRINALIPDSGVHNVTAWHALFDRELVEEGFCEAIAS